MENDWELSVSLGERVGFDIARYIIIALKGRHISTKGEALRKVKWAKTALKGRNIVFITPFQGLCTLSHDAQGFTLC